MGLGSKNLTCGICFQVLKTPVTLECHDDFCLECLRDALSSRSQDTGFVCPLCAATDSKVTRSNVDQCVNHQLQEFINYISGVNGAEPPCQWCEKAPAREMCIECMRIYCEECSRAVHLNAAKRSHKTRPLNDGYKSFNRRCHAAGHEEYRAEFYCNLCEELCCAYCLQVGPHRDHTHQTVARAAPEARQQLSRDLLVLDEQKSRMAGQVNELRRVSSQYSESYDRVEQLITEYFNHCRQQVMQRELEVRTRLATIRTSGDISLTTWRKQFLTKANGINDGLLRFRHLQGGGSDSEVLENRATLMTALHTDVPSVGGSGFRFSPMELTFGSMDVQLDLEVNDAMIGGHGRHRNSEAITFSTNRRMTPQQIAAEPILRLTFPVDDDVEATTRPEGVHLRCIARGSDIQIGVRSKELLESIAQRSDNGLITWQIRLDNITDSFVGVVEKSSSYEGAADGFYWKPSYGNVIDGHIGTITSDARRLPACKKGDIVRFVYELSSRTLRIVINNTTDCGVVVGNLHPKVAACFIFLPGESLTVLY